MQFAFTVASYLLGLLLDVLVITALLRLGWRRYPFLLLYVIADFLTNVVEIQPALGYASASIEAKRMYADLYWWNERILQVLVFAMVISLVYKAAGQLRPGRTIFTAIVLGTAAYLLATFFWCFDASQPSWKWMATLTRDWNFGAAILNLALWGTLISSREKDYRLLTVSGALGLQFTGGAIGQALRGMSASWQLVVGDLIYLTNLACLYIWWQVFRSNKKSKRPPPPPAELQNAVFRSGAPK